MSTKVLSYSLFTPKVLPQHRVHDRYKSESDRYWFNLPAVVLTNRILYPSHEMRLHITPNILEHRLAPILEIMNQHPNFSYQIIDMDYNSTEPAIWRMLPLWEREVEFLHTRDIDSVPTETEYRYTCAFEQSGCLLGTLRTHTNHYGVKCRMLAGLSSFRPNRVPTYMRHTDFHTYYSMKHGSYGSDQDLMIEQFTTSPEFTKLYFYDHRAYHQRNPQDFPCREATMAELEEIEINNRQKRLLRCLRETDLDSWAGEPIDARGRYTNYVLSLFPRTQSDIGANQVLEEFYKMDESRQ